MAVSEKFSLATGKTGVAVVGAGWMGGALLRRLAERNDVVVRCIVEKDPERGRAAVAAAGLPDTPVLDAYDAALACPGVQAVVLASPNSFHAPQALAALAAGKHVFCEKPCATTYADHLALVAADRRHPELTTFTDYILHFDPMETRLREMVAGDAFGKIVQLQVNYRNPVNVTGDKAWKLQKSLMGDAFGMAIIHALSVMLELMQAQGDAPVEVMATAMPAQRRPIEAEPIWNVLVRFASGAAGLCLGNLDFGNGYDAYHNLSGTHGGFVFESLADRPQKVRYWSERDTHGQWLWPFDAARCASQQLGSLAWPVDLCTPDAADVFEKQSGACVAHFLECVQRGKKSPLGFAAAQGIADLGWAAQVAAKLGRPVPLPLDEALARCLPPAAVSQA